MSAHEHVSTRTQPADDFAFEEGSPFLQENILAEPAEAQADRFAPNTPMRPTEMNYSPRANRHRAPHFDSSASDAAFSHADQYTDDEELSDHQILDEPEDEFESDWDDEDVETEYEETYTPESDYHDDPDEEELYLDDESEFFDVQSNTEYEQYAAIESDDEESLPLLFDGERPETEEEVDEEAELPTDSADGWVVPADVHHASETQYVKYDDAPPWDASKRNCTGTFTEGARTLQNHLMQMFTGIARIGGYNCRPNSASPHKVSIHGTGRALDVMIPTIGGRANGAIGDPIAKWLVLNASNIGIQYFIWNRVRWSGHRREGKFARYTGPNPHRDHLHVELNLDGSRMSTPWFANRESPLPRPANLNLNYARATRLNRSYGKSLGWQNRLADIARFLKLPSSAPQERDLVDALARWQQLQHLGVDGILGPNTWAKLKSLLGNAQAPPPAAPANPPLVQAVDWAQVSLEQRMRYVMQRLVRVYHFPENGAAGLVGNLVAESSVIPSRVEGSASARPMRARNFNNRFTTFTPEQVMNRNRHVRRGPRRPGVGLAQWTSRDRRAGLFLHTFEGQQLGAAVLFNMDAQIDYLVNELQDDYARVNRLLTSQAVTLEQAADEVVYRFEIPGSVLTTTRPRRRLPRNNAAVREVFRRRRRHARRALAAFRRAE